MGIRGASLRLRASSFYRMYAWGVCPSRLPLYKDKRVSCIRHTLGTICLVLGCPAADRSGEIVRHFAVRDAVRPL